VKVLGGDSIGHCEKKLYEHLCDCERLPTCSWCILLDRRYTIMWCNVYIMQLITELHVSTLQGHHQAYKIMVLTKTLMVILPTGSRGLQLQCSLKYSVYLG